MAAAVSETTFLEYRLKRPLKNIDMVHDPHDPQKDSEFQVFTKVFNAPKFLEFCSALTLW